MAVAESPISIYALGGLCEVGKNTYCIESENSLIIIDAGVMFPGADLPGVDYVIPDYSKLKNSRQKVKALFITHGHEDHIGGIPFLLQNLHIPVIFAPRLAIQLIQHKLEDMRIREEVKFVEYNAESVINVDEFRVTFFQVTHSIPDSYGIVVDTPQGRIVHTGDFKIDLTPVGQKIELSKIAKIGDAGVDLLLSDSTNAEIEGYTPSEKNVLQSIKDIFKLATGRLILSTFSSNISRIQQICDVAVENNRKIAIIGRSMEHAVDAARDFGYIKIPDTSFIPINEINEHKLSEICILCTGSQGEPMAALSRIANGEHKDLRIIPGDTIVFSSSAIPGNGVFIDRVVNQLVKKGGNVLVNSVLYSVHSSGHPSKQELRIMLHLIKPKYFMPIHGEYRMLKIHGQIAESLGVPHSNVFIMENGDSLILSKHKIVTGPHFAADPIYIDSKNVAGTNEAVVKDREIMRGDGMISIAVAINSKNSKIIVPPKCITRAFTADDNNIVKKIEDLANKTLTELMETKPNFATIKSTLKRTVEVYVERKTERKPLVIPVVMDENR